MSTIRMAATAAMAACGLMLVSGTGVASAQTSTQATPLKQVVALTGTVKSNKKAFKGTYTIERFISKGGKVYSVGKVVGKIGNRKVTKDGVKMPAALAQGQQAGASQLPVPVVPTSCQILNLDLGAINLNLLGLVVTTNPIHLNITAVPGAGNLLGNLLCTITNLLNPGTTPVSQVAALLTAILALLGG